jgi:hypothetical protein
VPRRSGFSFGLLGPGMVRFNSDCMCGARGRERGARVPAGCFYVLSRKSGYGRMLKLY